MNTAVIATLVIIAVSAGGGWLFGLRKPAEKPVRVMMFVGYFWLLAFIQLVLIALAYWAWKHF